MVTRLLIGLVLLGACQPSNVLVIERHPRSYQVLVALDHLNIFSGCGYYPTVFIGGRTLKKRRKVRNVTRVYFVEEGDPRLKGGNGYASYREDYYKCDIFLDSKTKTRHIAHELLHCQGFGHEESPSLMNINAPSWILPDDAVCIP